jgi:hypothetical protein
MRMLVAIAMVALLATSPAVARNASHHHLKRVTILKDRPTLKPDQGGVGRHPDDIALDRKIRKYLPRLLIIRKLGASQTEARSSPETSTVASV